jgi:hypothetical protein
VESRSGLELFERDFPIFAGLQSLVPGGIDFLSLAICLIEDASRVQDALAIVVGAAVVINQLFGPFVWQRAIIAVGEDRKNRTAPAGGPML